MSTVGNLEEESSSKKGSSQKEQQQQDRRIDIQPAEDEEGMSKYINVHNETRTVTFKHITMKLKIKGTSTK